MIRTSIPLCLFVASTLAGCGRADVTLELSLSEVVPTVATVAWDSKHGEIDSAWLEYGLVGAMDQTRDLPTDGSAVSVLGLKASHEYQARVVIEAEGQTYESASEAFETGSPPSDFPDVEVEVFDAASAHTGFLVTTLFVAPAAPVILDADGDYVWWYVPENANNANYSRAAISADARSIWAWTLNVLGPSGGVGDGKGPKVDDSFTLTDGDQALVQIAWDGSEVVTESVPDGHHDLVVLPSGSVAYLEYDRRSVDGTEYEGDRIVERSSDGSTTDAWSFWDEFEPSDSPEVVGMTWSHANALDYVPEEDAYYLSSLGLGSILKIDRASASVEWMLGGAESDFTESSELGYAPPMWGHQFEVLADSLLLFDNGDTYRMYSQVVEYQLDEVEYKADEIWSYRPDPDVYSFSLGDVQRLESGNTLVTFSNQGQVDEVSPDGELVWRLNMSIGGALGYLTHVDALP